MNAAVRFSASQEAAPTVDPLARYLLRHRILDCVACPLSEKNTPVPFRGPTPSPVAIIGEAPGAEENARGEPFVGPAGKLLQVMLREAGWDPNTLAYLNTVCCYPHGEPPKESIRACRRHLFDQLRLIHPRYLLVLGNIALRALHPNPEPIGRTRHHWWRLRVEDDGTYQTFPIWCLATYHPASVLRGGGQYRLHIVEDLEYVRMIAKDEIEPSLGEWCVKCGKGASRWVEDMPYCGTCSPPKMKNWEQERLWA